MYRKIEIRFDIYETEYFKSVIKGFKFAFSDVFPCILNFSFAAEITLKIGCLWNTWKKFRTKQKNRKGYVQPYKKMKKVLCFEIVSIQ